MQMALNSIKEGDLWFYAALRDNEYYSSAIFSFENCDIGLFLSILLFFIYKNSDLTNDKKENLLLFVNEKSKGFNSFDTTWSKSFGYMLNRTKIDSNFISRLLDVYKLIDVGTYDYLLSHDINSAKEFNEEFIINISLEIFLSGYYYNFYNLDIFNETLNRLSEEYEDSVLNVISQKWLDSSGKLIKLDSRFDFLKFYNLTCFSDFEHTELGKEFEQVLFQFLNNKRKIELKKKTSGKNDITKIKEHLISSLRKQIHRLPHFKEKLEESYCSKDYHFPINLEIEPAESESNIDFLSSHLKEEIKRLIKNKVNELIKRKEIQEESLTDLSIKPFLDFGATNQTCEYSDVEGISEKVRNALMKIENDNNGLIPTGVFYKEGFLEFCVDINQEKSFVRFLDDNEVNRIIDESYKIVNGAYFYNEYSNDDTKGILLNRQELFDIIKKKRIFIVVYFKLKLKIDETKYLAYSLSKRK